jgi:uncharacterized phage protein gp47/JayE
MAYLDLNKDFITEQTLEQLAQKSNISFLSPGAKIRLILDIVNEKLALQADQFDLNTGKSFIRNANGVLLDFIGELFGLQRIKARKAEISKEEKNFYFYTLEQAFGDINLNQNIVIPAGSVRIYNTENDNLKVVTYINSEQITIPATERIVYFSAESEGLGANFNVGANSLVFHNFKGYSDSTNRSLLVSNTASITYAEDEETDDNFRFRIQQQALAGEAANFSAIRLALLSIPGVSDVFRIRYPRGVGTTDWLIKAVTPVVPQRLIDTCQAAIETTQAEGMENLAKAPVIIGLELRFSITYRNRLENAIKDQIKVDIRKNITSYVNSLAIGEKLVIDQIKKSILNSDNRIESIGSEDTGLDFEKINIYKRSAISSSVVRRSIIGDYRTKTNERVVVEPDIETPIVITDNN